MKITLPPIPPGSWKYHVGRGSNPRLHIQTSGGYQIASTPELERNKSAHEENESRRATAQAFSALPALLAALADAYKRACEAVEIVRVYPSSQDERVKARAIRDQYRAALELAGATFEQGNAGCDRCGANDRAPGSSLCTYCHE